MSAPVPPSVSHALAGATVIARMASFPETLASTEEAEKCLCADSRRLACGMILAAPGRGESTTDNVYSGLCAVAENGRMLAENENSTSLTVTEIDVSAMLHVRRARGGFDGGSKPHYPVVWGSELYEPDLTRTYLRHPHLPEKEQDLPAYCERQIDMQVSGLVKRMEYASLDHCVVGISGGVDSTLAVMISALAVRRMGLPGENVIAVTMPCFGTSSRTKSNAVVVAEQWGCEVRVIDIGKSVYQHFDDIGHAHDDYSIAFENAQARMRTMILMDIANKVNGLNVGTEDLSEYIDGWCTYNGDHTSMYDVNIGVTKTQVRAAVAHIAGTTEDAVLKAALYDVLDCPVSPELLPIHDDMIEQKSEDSVGSYSLQDFFTYHVLINGFSPRKTVRLARLAYGDEFSDEELLRWLRSWCRRLFSQQFKRSCLMDGPSVGTFSVSPRTGFKMPSDAEAALFLKDLDELEDDLLLGDNRAY
jgi:NAD+ synthase (glutamine-hydrolysing)